MSSQSLIHKPEAPTAAFDLGIFSKVLMYKQAKFDQGADLIQSKISQLENQSVMGDAQKAYMSQKINSMVEGVNGMGGMDFSDRNVLNQISGQVDSVAKDPIIQSAITNTRNIQKGMSYWEKIKADAAAGKKGVYYNPANEYDYMESVNDYLRKSKSDAGAVYQERQIAPPIDVNSKLMAAAKDVVASKYTERDGTNKYILKTGEIVTPERLYQHALTQVQTDPALANQIRINAKYNYLQRDSEGNLNPAQLEGIKATYMQTTENKITSLQGELAGLAQKLAIAGSKDDQIRIQSQIDDTAKELENYEANRVNRENSINSMLATNPEQAASTVYTNKLLEGIVAAKAFREETVKFDNAAMFVDKMNLQERQFQFNQKMEEEKMAIEHGKLALSAQKTAAEIAKDAASSGGVDPSVGGIITQEASLPTNMRRSNQEAQVSQIRGVQMQQANVQQDYYRYLYEFKGATGLIQKDGKTYRPTATGANMWADNMKMLKDLRDGKKIPTTLDPEFIKIANRFQELDIVKRQYESTMVDVNREALQLKRKELGLSDSDYELFLRGKALVDQLPDVMVNAIVPAGTPKITTKAFDQVPTDAASQAAFNMYKKYNRDLKIDPDKVEQIYKQKGSQIIPRTITPVGLKQSDLDARAGALKQQISNRGFYTLDASGKPEETRGEDFMQDKIKYIGDSYMDLGNGFRPYVKAEITRGEGKDAKSETVFVDVDEDYASNFKNFATNVNEAARQQILKEDSMTYDSMSSDGRNVIQTKIVKNTSDPGDESATVQVYVTHDAKGKPITPYPITVAPTKGMTISQCVEFAKRFADSYSAFYQEARKAGKIGPTPAKYLEKINGQ